MLRELFNEYIDDIDTIKLRVSGIGSGIEQAINKDLNNYKNAVLIDLYLTQLIDGNENTELKKKALNMIEVKSVEKNEGRVLYEIKNKKRRDISYSKIIQSRRALKRYQSLIEHMYENELISLIIKFENIISNLFYVLVKRFPDCYINEQRITYSDLCCYKTVDDIKEKVVKEKVELLMRDNFFSWIKVLYEKHKIVVKDESRFYNDFIESYYRRNIIVHNNGVVNSDYKNAVKSNVEVGEKLFCNEEYFDNAIQASIYIIVKILCESSKVFVEERENLISDIIDYGVNLIDKEKYLLARDIFKMIKNMTNITQEIKIYCQLNYWQTFKWNGDFENEIKQDINIFDVSACNEYIKLGKYALLDDFEKIFDILNKKINTEEAYEYINALEEWPIFKEVRIKEEYYKLRDENPDAFSQESDTNEEEISDNVLKEKNGKLILDINGFFTNAHD